MAGTLVTWPADLLLTVVPRLRPLPQNGLIQVNLGRGLVGANVSGADEYAILLIADGTRPRTRLVSKTRSRYLINRLLEPSRPIHAFLVPLG